MASAERICAFLRHRTEAKKSDKATLRTLTRDVILRNFALVSCLRTTPAWTFLAYIPKVQTFGNSWQPELCARFRWRTKAKFRASYMCADFGVTVLSCNSVATGGWRIFLQVCRGRGLRRHVTAHFCGCGLPRISVQSLKCGVI